MQSLEDRIDRLMRAISAAIRAATPRAPPLLPALTHSARKTRTMKNNEDAQEQAEESRCTTSDAHPGRHGLPGSDDDMKDVELQMKDLDSAIREAIDRRRSAAYEGAVEADRTGREQEHRSRPDGSPEPPNRPAVNRSVNTERIEANSAASKPLSSTAWRGPSTCHGREDGEEAQGPGRGSRRTGPRAGGSRPRHAARRDQAAANTAPVPAHRRSSSRSSGSTSSGGSATSSGA